jgi:replicative DNA helicase
MIDPYGPAVQYSDSDAPAEDGAGREPQWDLLAEQSAIGSMMLDRNVIDDVMDEALPGDFYRPRHEIVAIAIGTLYAKNAPTDVISVVDELRRTEKLTMAGGADYLHELTSIPATTANAGYHALIVKQLAVKRRLAEAGIRIAAMGNASEGDVEDLVEKARVEVELVTTGQRRIVRPVGETFSLLVDELEHEPTYAPSPWESLDRLIGGFAPGALYVLAARPGAGKSIAALQIAARMAHEGMVAFCSLEMTEQELQKRLVAQYGPVHMTQLRNHTLNVEDWKRVAEARQRVQGAPIFIDDQAGVTISHIRSHARNVARRGKLAVVVVDYLQLVKGEGQSRQEVVGSVARNLKELAKELGVPVIAAAQARRSGEKRGSKQLPGLEDLRESGDIENAADVVILMDRDREKAPDDLRMVVAKNRHGDLGQFTLQWQAQYARLRDKKWSPTALFD